jgi:hypothetical protein
VKEPPSLPSDTAPVRVKTAKHRTKEAGQKAKKAVAAVEEPETAETAEDRTDPDMMKDDVKREASEDFTFPAAA